MVGEFWREGGGCCGSCERCGYLSSTKARKLTPGMMRIDRDNVPEKRKPPVDSASVWARRVTE